MTAACSFVDETVPRRIEVTAFNLSTDEIAPGKPFTDTEIAGVLHLDGFAPEGVPFRLEVPKAVLPEDFASVEVSEFTVAFGGFEAEGAVNGTLGENPKLAGKIESNEFDPRALLTSVGIAPPKTTDAQALGKVRFAGSWALRLRAPSASIRSRSRSTTLTSPAAFIAPRATIPWANLRCAGMS